MSPGRIERIAERVAGPEPLPAAQLTAQLADGVDPGSHGRLVELAGWWLEVRPRAAAPVRVVQLGGRDLPAPAGVEFSVRVLALPPAPGDALEWGVALADEVADAGADLILLSLPDRPAADALAGSLMDLDPVDVLGWPRAAGLDDAAWSVAISDLRDALRRLHGLRGDPDRQLDALGSPVMAAGAGVLVESARRRTPLILDGYGAAICALTTRVAARAARDWWQAGQAPAEGLHARALTSLRLEPLTRLEILAEDGTSARLGLDVLLAATRLLRDG